MFLYDWDAGAVTPEQATEALVNGIVSPSAVATERTSSINLDIAVLASMFSDYATTGQEPTDSEVRAAWDDLVEDCAANTNDSAADFENVRSTGLLLGSSRR